MVGLLAALAGVAHEVAANGFFAVMAFAALVSGWALREVAPRYPHTADAFPGAAVRDSGQRANARNLDRPGGFHATDTSEVLTKGAGGTLARSEPPAHLRALEEVT